MKHRMVCTTIFICALVGALVSAGASAQGLDTLAAWMTGSFSSERQAAADSSYVDIRLVMARIWQERADGYWLYVEQAEAGNLEAPYRQRVYRLTETEGGSFRSDVYELPGPRRFAGAWRERRPLSELSPDSLAARPGCAVILDWYENGMYVGSTVGSECASRHRGASYATSEVIVERTRIMTWDRGYDAEGEQVWGAEEGGFEFDKIRAATYSNRPRPAAKGVK